MAEQGKKSKRPDNRPARSRYWARRSLERNKVRNLVKHNGMEPPEALAFWRRARQNWRRLIPLGPPGGAK